MIIILVLVNTNGKIYLFTKVHSKMVKNMERVYLLLQIKIYTTANFRMINTMVRDNLLGLMEIHTMVTFWMENNLEKVS